MVILKLIPRTRGCFWCRKQQPTLLELIVTKWILANAVLIWFSSNANGRWLRPRRERIGCQSWAIKSRKDEETIWKISWRTNSEAIKETIRCIIAVRLQKLEVEADWSQKKRKWGVWEAILWREKETQSHK